LKKFTILLKTIPNKVDLYDIWEIRPIIEKIEKNLKYLTNKEKQEFINLINDLNYRLNSIKILDELAKEEVKKLFDLIKKEKNILKVA
jgi:uncharacterized protein (UPF0305 family)